MVRIAVIAADLVSILEQSQKDQSANRCFQKKRRRCLVRSINQTYLITLFKQAVKEAKN